MTSMIAWLRAKEATEPGWAERVWNKVGRRCDEVSDAEAAALITAADALSVAPMVVNGGAWKDLRLELGLVSKHRRAKGGEPGLGTREDLGAVMAPEPCVGHAGLIVELQELTIAVRQLTTLLREQKPMQAWMADLAANGSPKREAVMGRGDGR